VSILMIRCGWSSTTCSGRSMCLTAGRAGAAATGDPRWGCRDDPAAVCGGDAEVGAASAPTGRRVHRLRPSPPAPPYLRRNRGTDGHPGVAQLRDGCADLASVQATLRSEDSLEPLLHLGSLAEVQAKLAAI
jgi:hypothetical protein